MNIILVQHLLVEYPIATKFGNSDGAYKAFQTSLYNFKVLDECRCMECRGVDEI